MQFSEQNEREDLELSCRGLWRIEGMKERGKTA